MKLVYFIKNFLFLLIFTACSAFAAPSPMDMLQTTSDQMLAQLKAHQSTLKSDPQRVFQIVDDVLLPHVDMEYMSRSVVGRAGWANSNSQEKQEFTHAFTELLTRTYASALAAYTNQTVKFYPIRGGYANASQVTVHSEIIQPSGPPVPMTYNLLLEGEQWKVIDFSVDNVSIVNNFRAQFANDLNQGGLSNLTEKLRQHNQELAKQDTSGGGSNND